MIAQDFYHPAALDRAASALIDHAVQFGLQGFEPRDAGLNRLGRGLCHIVHGGAGLVGSVRHARKLADRAQRKARLARLADEGGAALRVVSVTAQVMDELGSDAERVQPVFNPVDPARDRRLGLVVQSEPFQPSFLGLAGDAAASAAARRFKVYFEREAEPPRCRKASVPDDPDLRLRGSGDGGYRCRLAARRGGAVRSRSVIRGLGAVATAAGGTLALGAGEPNSVRLLPLTAMGGDLTDHRGQGVTPAGWAGGPVMAIFGFT